MEFKGTKESWLIDYPVIYADDYFQTHICSIPDVYTDNIAKANALLISKAPEMLQMLQRIYERKTVTFDDLLEIKKLIKEATEI